MLIRTNAIAMVTKIQWEESWEMSCLDVRFSWEKTQFSSDILHMALKTNYGINDSGLIHGDLSKLEPRE